VPKSIQELQRNRWLTKTDGLQDVALWSACHQLDEEIVAGMIERVTGKRPKSKAEPTDTIDDDWALPALLEARDVDPSQEYQDPEHLLNRPRCPSSPEDWTEFNEKQRGDAYAFVAKGPRNDLLITTKVTMLMLKIMTKMLERASDSWMVERFAEALLTGRMVRTRLVDSCSGRISMNMFKETNSLLRDSSLWSFMPDAALTKRNTSLACSMLSRAACGVQAGVHNISRSFPLKLFSMIDNEEESATTVHSVTLFFKKKKAFQDGSMYGPPLGSKLAPIWAPHMGPDMNPDIGPNMGPDTGPEMGPHSPDMGPHMGPDIGPHWPAPDPNGGDHHLVCNCGLLPIGKSVTDGSLRHQ
jgi:hypothetical protein